MPVVVLNDLRHLLDIEEVGFIHSHALILSLHGLGSPPTNSNVYTLFAYDDVHYLYDISGIYRAVAVHIAPCPYSFNYLLLQMFLLVSTAKIQHFP